MSEQVLVSKRKTNSGKTTYWIFCPACNEPIMIDDGWHFNENFELPTFNPSLLSTHMIDGKKHTCHSFIRDGHWQYLSDCSHEYAGKTMPMVPLPDWMFDSE